MRGLEPLNAEPESAVLPLHYIPTLQFPLNVLNSATFVKLTRYRR